MKNLLLILFAVLLFQACDNIESNTVALQANVETGFFKAFSATATLDENMAFTIMGQSDNQELVLHTQWRGQQDYELGVGFESYATFKDSEGNIFTTDTEGSEGVITITSRGDNEQIVSGKFQFRSVLPGRDTIVVHQGLFYSVPFTYIDNSTGD